MEGDQRRQFRLIGIRTVVLGGLLALPVLICAVAGTVAVWKVGWMSWLWWVIPACWVITWLVARIWSPPQPLDAELPNARHWTPRDQAAAAIVQRYQRQVDSLNPADLVQMQFYLQQSQALAQELAAHYHPGVSNPVDALTIPEIAAAIRLVADDLESLVLESVPGSRLLNVRQWRALGKAPKWIRRATNTAWAAAILINPLNIARYGSSRMTSDQVANSLQNELLATLYLRFMRQVGFYLIEMNSGRLRGGTAHWRRTFETSQHAAPGSASETTRRRSHDSPENPTTKLNPTTSARSVRMVVVGQTGAGRSRLVAELARLSATVSNRSDEDALAIQLANSGQTVTVAELPGYGEAGASRSEQDAMQTAVNDADAVILVANATSPAREPDRQVLQALRDHGTAHPDRPAPPVIVALTHVDLLPPVLRWSPPAAASDWSRRQDPKFENIREAIAYTQEALGGLVAECVPVCLAVESERAWGVAENLIPAIIRHLDQARSVSLVTAFESELDRDWIGLLLRQASRSGKQVLQTWLTERLNRLDR